VSPSILKSDFFKCAQILHRNGFEYTVKVPTFAAKEKAPKVAFPFIGSGVAGLRLQ
jgi:hypothetical protein